MTFDIVLANLLTTLAASVVWVVNLTFFRHQMPALNSKVGWLVLVMTVGTAMGAQLARTLFNYGWIDFDTSQLIAAVSRWSYLLVGIGLLWNAWAERRRDA